ncbi:MAG: copper resistance protein CopC [Vallitaleaceae bacterium]|nr:copper resistance protein CopC [Vallitaleaceae bacterium]
MKHLIITVTAALLLMASGVHAHSHLEKSLPANNSVVTTSPTEIKLHFSTVVRLTSITIQKDGEKEQRLRPASAAAAKTATAPVSLLSPGKYLVAWHAVGEDGHAVSGKFHFTVTNERDLKKDARPLH